MSEVDLGVYDVYFIVEEEDCSVFDFVRVTAEDENHAEDLARQRQYMPHGVYEVLYRGAA